MSKRSEKVAKTSTKNILNHKYYYISSVYRNSRLSSTIRDDVKLRSNNCIVQGNNKPHNSGEAPPPVFRVLPARLPVCVCVAKCITLITRPSVCRWACACCSARVVLTAQSCRWQFTRPLTVIDQRERRRRVADLAVVCQTTAWFLNRADRCPAAVARPGPWTTTTTHRQRLVEQRYY